MKFLFRITILIVLLKTHHAVSAQEDSTYLDYTTFLELVKNNHPMTYRANLKAESGELKLQKARGNFDPKLEGSVAQKYFDAKQYYNHTNLGLKVPTWFGLTVQAGYDDNGGERLNPERYTPDEGLWYAGLSLTLGKGLFIDERRAELKQAKIFRNSTAIEQRLMLNQLLYDASIVYWEWYKAYNKWNVYREALINAQFRLDGVKQSAELGYKPYVDTLKATIQVQNRALKLNEYLLDFENKTRKLEVFLWQDGFIPLVSDSTLIPETFKRSEPTTSGFVLPENMDSLVLGHPEILFSQNEIEISKIDFRLKTEMLKPEVTLKYNALNSGTVDNYSVENYQWGVQVSYPLFTRKERADRKLTELKINEQQAKLAEKNAWIEYKIRKAHNNWNGLAYQVEIYKQATNNYELLYEAEVELFNNGESSLFLVNTRDQDWINAQIKLIDLLYANQLAKMSYSYQAMLFN